MLGPRHDQILCGQLSKLISKAESHNRGAPIFKRLGDAEEQRLQGSFESIVSNFGQFEVSNV